MTGTHPKVQTSNIFTGIMGKIMGRQMYHGVTAKM